LERTAFQPDYKRFRAKRVRPTYHATMWLLTATSGPRAQASPALPRPPQAASNAARGRPTLCSTQYRTGRPKW